MSHPSAEADLTAPVIAIDGPSGSGKGTLASRMADELRWHLLDSGALYRIVACVGSQRGIALDAQLELAELAADLDISFKNAEVRVDGQELSKEIRREEISIGASQVAALPPVRAAVLGIQRAMRQQPGLIADGRDMGTVVFPDAPLKIFLDASAEVRADRRYNQLKNKGLGVSLRALLDSIHERDERDRQRAVSPLKPADDAVLLDSTELTIEEVIAVVMTEVDSRNLRRT